MKLVKELDQDNRVPYVHFIYDDNGEKLAIVSEESGRKIIAEIEKWMFALLDIVDGDNEYDLKDKTGLSEERCKEIMEMYYEATKNGWPKKTIETS